MLEFKSSENGATIRFSKVPAPEFGDDFHVEVSCPFGFAQTNASTYHVGSPVLMFRSMADEWKGWKGEKSWGDLDGKVQFSARSDSLGHTRFTVRLTDYETSFESVLVFEAGQLERMANEIGALFP